MSMTETEDLNDFDKPVVVVVPGDLHLTEPSLENVQAAHRVVDDVNALIRPDFVQFIGDNVQDATEEQFQLFNQIRGRLDVPHFALIGDHDIKNDPYATAFRRHVGEPYGAMSLRGFRFVRLNTQESRPVGISAGQIDWFRHELDQAGARGERIVVFQHNYPYQIWEDFAGPGIDDWRGLVQTHQVEAIVCGHTHYWQVANDGRNALIAVRSIGDPEGGAPGYAVLYWRGDDLAVTYRSVDERGPLLLVTHPRERLLATGPRHIVSGSDRVVARVWSGSRVLSVRYCIDGGAWAGLDLTDDSHWQGRLPVDRLAKGVHSLEVVAVTADGTEGSQRTEFMVDPTGRYTPVPEARPVVTSTAFC
jgi:3',5'-cyclic-AMP phosphodiesterase